MMMDNILQQIPSLMKDMYLKDGLKIQTVQDGLTMDGQTITIKVMPIILRVVVQIYTQRGQKSRIKIVKQYGANSTTYIK